jgi:NAD(P)-dependent dehydrogenase (short-subunit alcohol dehydrogenase family)
MDLELAGRRVLVTGASRGIGLAIVRAFTAEGARVVASARRPTPELAATGADFVAADLSTEQGPRELVAAVLDRDPRLDVLVNNAGGGDVDASVFADAFGGDEAIWERTFALNLNSAVRTTRAALPALTAARGAVVNISSDSARKAAGAPLPYAAAKGALNVFSRGLAEQVAATGVRVNAISPSGTRTSVWTDAGGFAEASAAALGVDHEALVAGAPAQLGMLTGALIDPAEIARAVLLLASPAMPSAVGANWLVDGGAVKYA